ncbi:LysR family transcriptional regulator [Globicatella sulfidifaciens]
MDIRQLKYFIAIAESKNLSRAAKSLFITQPTLSQTIKKLESELNTVLFKMTDEGMMLTVTGQVLYDDGIKIIEDFEKLIDKVSQYKQQPIEKIKVGLTTLFAIQFMKQISHFIATHSNVELAIFQEGSRQLQKMLVEKEIDVGLLSFPQLYPEIAIEPLATSTKGYWVSVVIAENNPLAKKEAIQIIDLKGQNISSLTHHFMLGEMLTRSCHAAGFDPNIVFTHNDWAVLLHSLKELNAVTILPSEFQALSDNKGLKWIPFVEKNNFYPIGIATRKDFVTTSAIQEFIEAIKSN